MIRINLASKASRSLTGGAGKSISVDANAFNAAASPAGSQRQAVSKALFALVIPVVLYIYQTQIVNPELTQKIAFETEAVAALNKVISASKTALNEKNKFEEDKKKIQAQRDTIDSLKQTRLFEVKLLDLVQKGIPERVWLSGLDFKDGKVSVTGQATADLEVTKLMDALQQNVFIKEVFLLRSTESSSERGTIKNFQISVVLENPNNLKPRGQNVK